MEFGDESNEPMDIDEANEIGGGTTNTGSMFSSYDPSSSSFLHLYRPQADVVASLIHYSGMEGIDRYEISKQFGINAKTKAGNRAVSNSIHTVMKTYPSNFGIFQKMEGKHRFLKYYAKSGKHTPAGGTALAEFYRHFKELTGVECPYKLGDSIKFPQQNLSTLRISDVTLKRLVRILKYVYQEEVIITQPKIESYISSEERKEGYTYQVDRKSLKKCIIALARKNFVNTMKLEITERKMTTLVDVITTPKIKTLDHPLILDAIKQIKAEFKEQGKSFPSGVRLKQEPEAKTSENEAAKSDDGTCDVKHEEMEQCEIGGSLLNKAFNTLQRISMQRYAKKAGGTPISVLSQRSLNSLVDSAKRRRLTKPMKGTKKRRLTKEKGQTEHNDEEQCPISLAKLGHLHKKNPRIYDTVDRLSLQHKAYLRSRFTQRERDMLLLIRACSFFLNPVARFWPNPKVIRTLMHEYVPESRTKTTYSLMAAGVREVRSKERYAHHQYIVKTMASYKELLDLRNHLASLIFPQSNKVDDQLQQKDFFFMNAFRTSYQLLFRESVDFPSVRVTDSELRRYLDSNNLYFLSTPDRQKAVASRLRKKLSDENEIPHFIAFNTILSVILSSVDFKNNKTKAEKLDEEHIEATDNNVREGKARIGGTEADTANFVIEQLEIQVLADVLEKMRTGGLVTKRRTDMRQPLCLRAGVTTSETASNENGTQNVGQAMEVPTEGRQCFDRQCAETAGAMRPLANNTTESAQKSDTHVGGEWRNQLKCTCTQFFQHFFQPEYHKNLCDSLAREYLLTAKNRISHNFGDYECPGQFLALADFLCKNFNEFSIKTSMPNSIKELFCTQSSMCNERLGSDDDGNDVFETLTASATKQLRYLENTELRLELLKVRPEIKRSFIDSLIQSLPSPECLISVQIVPRDKIPDETTEAECIANITNNDGRQDSQENLRSGKKSSSECNCSMKLRDLVDESGLVGISEAQLKERMAVHGFDAEMMQQKLNMLLESVDLLMCGIDEVRFVSMRNCSPWLIRTRDGQGFVPKPWLLPSGRVNWKILRWMLEGVLSVVFNRSGTTEQELVSHFLPVLQPALTIELIQILFKLGCLSQSEKLLTETRKSDPFLRFGKTKAVRFFKTNIDGLERFVLFNEFKLKSFL